MRIKLQDKSTWHGKFIWWPREIDGHLVWLESVWRRERYVGPGIFIVGIQYQYALTIPKED